MIHDEIDLRWLPLVAAMFLPAWVENTQKIGPHLAAWLRWAGLA